MGLRASCSPNGGDVGRLAPSPPWRSAVILLDRIGAFFRWALRRPQPRQPEEYLLIDEKGYAEAIARVAQEAFEWKFFRKVCEKLDKAATERGAIWFEAGAYVHAIIRFVVPTNDALTSKALRHAAEIFVDHTPASNLPPDLGKQFRQGFEARIEHYGGLLRGSDPLGQVGRSIATSIGVTDTFLALSMSGTLVRLAALLKDLTGHIQLRRSGPPA